ncbi:hypothetical protein [Arcobacter sp. CECT 8989]|uniref:hypothetical protein n=1 Tax=Arcobacteraceae TaxID=2808963 RepID=UPI00100AF796|nr:hypothetical protein [Arcobacter sp. CECT 8989]RXK00016.1 hypothetical protein CRV02_10370 [Arcobacter sp. CECT 8989]
MTKIIRSILLILVTSVFITGCATWQEVKKDKVVSAHKVSFELKEENWYALKGEKNYSITKDGVLLQKISLNVLDLEKGLSKTKKNIPSDILSHQLAELIIEELRLVNDKNSFNLVSNNPEQLDTAEAVQIIYQTKDNDNNTIKTNSSYFIFDKNLYLLSYSAPLLHFYGKDLDLYQQFKKTIKLDK